VTLDDVLRAAIRKTGKTSYRLGKDTGIPQQTIDRFLDGADMKLSTASRLCHHLKLRLSKAR